MTPPVDISSVDFWSRPFEQRDERFARLRGSAPVSRHPALETPGVSPHRREHGFWAVTTADLITEVSRDSARFSSAVGQVSVRPTPYRLVDNMLVTDPPDHTAYRSAVASMFAPAGLRRMQPAIDRAVRQIVLRSTFRHEFDLVPGVAAGVPARVLAVLLGVPPSETERFIVAADAFASARLPGSVDDRAALERWFAEQSAYLVRLFDDLARFRCANPSDDLVSLISQGPGADRLDAAARRSTLLLLVVAGHDTMKQLISLSVLALLRAPDQLAWLLEDFDARFDRSFDELVRHASPVLSFARTATADTTLGDVPIRAGDRLALFYCSGNRDERRFDDPHALRLDRVPNHHVGLGGGGVHFCLGGALARMQLHATLRTLFEHAPGLALAGDPVFGFDDAVHRVDRLGVRTR